MTPIAFLRQMLDAGLDMEAAMRAAEAFETSAQAEHDKLVASLLDRLSVDAKAEKRRAKDRARKAATKNGIPRNSTESAETAESKEGPQTPKKDTPFPPLKGGTSPETEAAQPEKPETTEPQKSLTVWVSEIWDDTPSKGRQRSGKDLAHNALRAAIRKGADPASVRAGLAAYYASPDATKSDGEYAKGLHRAIQNGLWQAFDPPPDRPPPGGDDPWPTRLLRWQTSQYWNSEWGPKPGKPGYQGPEPQARAA